jgi:hypothetical protein
MASAVKKHQTKSLSLFHSSTGPGKDFEKRLALLHKVSIRSFCLRQGGWRGICFA